MMRPLRAFDSQNRPCLILGFVGDGHYGVEVVCTSGHTGALWKADLSDLNVQPDETFPDGWVEWLSPEERVATKAEWERRRQEAEDRRFAADRARREAGVR